MSDRFYDPIVRELHKQAARDKDERDLVEGRVSVADLRRRNAFIPPEIARAAGILNWKEIE